MKKVVFASISLMELCLMGVSLNGQVQQVGRGSYAGAFPGTDEAGG